MAPFAIPRSYAPLRLPTVRLPRLHSSLACRYLAFSLVFVSPLAGLADGLGVPLSARALWSTGYPLSSGPFTRGNSRISQVPELPLWMHAPLFLTTVVLWVLALTLGSGGLSFSFETVLSPAPLVVYCAPSTSAFRFDDSVGFPSRFVRKLSSDHNDDVFRGSITRPASSLHPAPDPRSHGRLRVHYGPAG